MNLVPAINTLDDDMPRAKPAVGEDNWTESFIFWVYLDDGRHFYVHLHLRRILQRVRQHTGFQYGIRGRLEEYGLELRYRMSINQPTCSNWRD